MKFIVSSAFLKSKIAALFSVVNASTVLPILEDIFIDADKEKKTITFKATDLENVMTVTIKDVEIGESGKVCIPASQLKSILKIAEQPLTFSCDKNFVVTVIGYDFRIKLTGENPDNYPKRPDPEILSQGTYDTKDFLPELRKAAIFCSNDDLRPAMTGVYVHERNEKLWIVGTDAHRLFYKEIHIPTTLQYKQEGASKLEIDRGMNFIMPKKAVILLYQLNKVPQIKIEYGRNHTRFVAGEYTLVCRNIDARFPDYTQVFPQLDQSFCLNRKDAIAFINIAQEFANRSTYQMKLLIDPHSERIELTTEDVDFSMEFYCTLRAYNMKMKDSMTIAFNARFILENLRQNNDEYVLIEHCGSPTRAMIFDKQLLTMPLMLNS